MFTELAKFHLAPLVLRLGLGIIFLYHGAHKVSEGGGTTWMKGPEAQPVYVQLPVAWGEFLGGIALIVGFMSRVAAAGIIIIMAGAIVTYHGKHGFSLANQGYEYNFALIVMALAIILLGSGAFSVDHYLWRRRRT